FIPSPCVLSLVTRERRSAPAPPLPPLRNLQTAMRTPLSLLFFKLNKPSDLSHSS
ncbi:unnamed protein product, partial [Bubo scandiacus]